MQRFVLSTVLALSLATSAAFAQQPQAAPQAQPDTNAPMHHSGHHRKPDAHRQAMMLSHRLNLNADQTARLEPILASRQEKMSALMADQSLTQDARRQQFKAIHQDTKQQLAGVLTPEQLSQMKSMRHGRGMHHQGQQPQGAAPTGM